MKSKILFSFFAVLLSFLGIAQNPGVTCAGAVSLNVNPTCATTNYSMNSTTYNSPTSLPGCGGQGYYEGWYKFTTPSFATTISINESAPNSHNVSIWASCAATTSLYCFNAPGGGTINQILSGLSLSTTYYIRIQRNNSSGNIAGTICLVNNTPAPTGPSNSCTGVPANLTVGTSCTPTSYTMSASTYDFTGIVPSCTPWTPGTPPGGINELDGWYSFVANNDTLQLSDLANYNRVVSVWTLCMNGTELFCSNAAANVPINITMTVLVPGDTYYVQIYQEPNSSNSTLSGSICIAQPPLGNYCSSPLPVPTVTTSCNTTNFTLSPPFNFSGVIPTCATGTSGAYVFDQWYSFVASNDTTIVDITASGNNTLAVWSACTSGQLACNTSSGANSLTLTGLTNGQTYYVQIISTSSTMTGTICVYNFAPGNTCATAIALSTVTTACNPTYYFFSSANNTFSGIGPGCSTSTGNYQYDGWYSFVATATTAIIDETGTGNRWITVWPDCTGTNAVGCSYTNNNSTSFTVNNLTIGGTYYIQIIRRSTSNSLNGTICVRNFNDEPCSAINLPVGTSCFPITGSTANASATTGVPSPNCSYNNYDDVWYNAVVPAGGALIVEGTPTNNTLGIALYSGLCGNLTYINCTTSSNTATLLPTGLTPGDTIFIRVWRSSSNSSITFDLCVREPNDNPCSAYNLTVGANCNPISGTTSFATPSGIPAPSPGCATYNNNDDVWYSAVVPPGSNGDLITEADLSENGGMAIYSGPCYNPTFISCTNSNNNLAMTTTGWSPGDTIFIRLWRTNNNSTMTFDICVYATDCSANTTNDYCEGAATLTSSPGFFGSATAALYTYDNPDNVESVFCGTIQNNSWYKFVASSTTATFPITSVSGCDDGIQAQVYSFNTSTGCCLDPVAKSNCYNPGNSNTLGTITATGLTVGQTYYLMIDGWAGANCYFSISGWTATGVLPIKLIEFTGVADTRMNRLKWRTASEINSDVIVVQKSEDGINFTTIGSVKGAGNSTTGNTYSFDDYEVNHTLAYYRLKQIDFDGTFEYSKTISVVREGKVELYPNPTNGDITVKFADAIENDWTITFTDLYGRNVTSSVERINASSNQLVFATDALKKGYYFVKVLNGSGEQIFNNSFIKE
ncbi:MAG: T9SS type A sorting domain-containing protein [Crocinitomicaceae bacterium]